MSPKLCALKGNHWKNDGKKWPVGTLRSRFVASLLMSTAKNDYLIRYPLLLSENIQIWRILICRSSKRLNTLHFVLIANLSFTSVPSNFLINSSLDGLSVGWIVRPWIWNTGVKPCKIPRRMACPRRRRVSASSSPIWSASDASLVASWFLVVLVFVGPKEWCLPSNMRANKRRHSLGSVLVFSWLPWSGPAMYWICQVSNGDTDLTAPSLLCMQVQLRPSLIPTPKSLLLFLCLRYHERIWAVLCVLA